VVTAPKTSKPHASMDHEEDPTGSLIGWILIFIGIFIGGICLLASLHKLLPFLFQ